MKLTGNRNAKQRRIGTRRNPVEAFLALPEDEKQRIARSYDRAIPLSETRPLNASERRLWGRVKRKGRGRP
jgi:hypothetical protein